MVDEQEIQVIGAPEQSIPKYATNVKLSKLSNGDIILSFMSRADGEGPAALIETIMVDEDHAVKIADKLNEIINANGQDGSN